MLMAHRSDIDSADASDAADSFQIVETGLLLAAGGSVGSNGGRIGVPRMPNDRRSMSANQRGPNRRPAGGPPSSRRMSGAPPGEADAGPKTRGKQYTMMLKYTWMLSHSKQVSGHGHLRML